MHENSCINRQETYLYQQAFQKILYCVGNEYIVEGRGGDSRKGRREGRGDGRGKEREEIRAKEISLFNLIKCQELEAYPLLLGTLQMFLTWGMWLPQSSWVQTLAHLEICSQSHWREK